MSEIAVFEPTPSSEIDRLVKYWWTCWSGMHWGFRRHAVVYWVCTGQVPAWEAQEVLGINCTYPVDVVVFHRELAVQQVPEYDLAQMIVNMTPVPERKELARFFAGRNAFECGEGSTRTIADLMNPVLTTAGMPKLRMTDDGPSSRISSARMIFDGIRRTYVMRGDDPPKEPGNTPLLLISPECTELIAALPSLIYDTKDEEEVKNVGTIHDDVFSAAKNSYRDYLSVRASAPVEVLRKEAMEKANTPTGQYLNLLKFDHDMTMQKRRPRRR